MVSARSEPIQLTLAPVSNKPNSRKFRKLTFAKYRLSTGFATIAETKKRLLSLRSFQYFRSLIVDRFEVFGRRSEISSELKISFRFSKYLIQRI